MAELAYSLITGGDLKEMKFENGRCIYTDYEKVTPDNVKEFLARRKNNNKKSCYPSSENHFLMRMTGIEPARDAH